MIFSASVMLALILATLKTLGVTTMPWIVVVFSLFFVPWLVIAIEILIVSLIALVEDLTDE